MAHCVSILFHELGLDIAVFMVSFFLFFFSFSATTAANLFSVGKDDGLAGL
jgi:hypothetical protein